MGATGILRDMRESYESAFFDEADVDGYRGGEYR